MSFLRKKVSYSARTRKMTAFWPLLVLGLALLVGACGDATATVNPATTSAATTPPTATAPIAPTTASSQAVGSSTTVAIAATQFVATNTIGTPPAATNTVTAVPATAIPVTTTPALKAIVQPKVIRTASDSYRKTIQFTEQPVTLNDGIPSLLWFDAEN